MTWQNEVENRNTKLSLLVDLDLVTDVYIKKKWTEIRTIEKFYSTYYTFFNFPVKQTLYNKLHFKNMAIVHLKPV